MKLLFFDVETTGVKHWKNGIHQISGFIDIKGEVKESFDFKVKPYPMAEIEPDALQVSGITKEHLDSYPPMETVYKQLVQILSRYVSKFNKQDKFHLVGYNNASFDNNFLRAFFVQNKDNYFGSWLWSSAIDVMVLAAEHLKEVRHEMVDFKLMTVAEQMGIEVDHSKLHDATYDIELTRDIYYRITNIKKPVAA